MPGFLMHLVEGEMILKQLHGKRQLSDSDRLFLLGCILPDVTENKDWTHFRPAWQKNLITKYPDMEFVLQKYSSVALSPIDFGILAHLHLDAGYVTDFWQDYFTFQKADGTPSTDIRDNLYVKLYASPDLCIPLSEFFSETYFYREYDILNPILYRDFQPFIPVDVAYQKQDIHITECIPENPAAINRLLQTYIPTDNFINRNDTHDSPIIFPYDAIVRFLEKQADKFVSIYPIL